MRRVVGGWIDGMYSSVASSLTGDGFNRLTDWTYFEAARRETWKRWEIQFAWFLIHFLFYSSGEAGIQTHNSGANELTIVPPCQI